MSTCISRAGEYSDHAPSDQPFICGRCYAFDEDAALAEVEALRAEVERLRQVLSGIANWRSLDPPEGSDVSGLLAIVARNALIPGGTE